MIPNEEHIHKMYGDMQKEREDKVMHDRAQVESQNPAGPFDGRQAYHSSSSRFTSPSFRSVFFNVGQGIKVVAAGDTCVVAKFTVPHFHAGVLTGFSQYFGDCVSEIENQITWGIRINGLPPPSFMDFVGRFSSLMIPHAVYFPLAGGAVTLGASTVSIGGSTELYESPTIVFSATNNASESVVIQGRLEGYTFPTAERNDEFANV
jgi:hypothetical protein